MRRPGQMTRRQFFLAGVSLAVLLPLMKGTQSKPFFSDPLWLSDDRLLYGREIIELNADLSVKRVIKL